MADSSKESAMSDLSKESTLFPSSNNDLLPSLPTSDRRRPISTGERRRPISTTERRPTSVYGQAPHAEHGPLIDHQIAQAHAVQAEPDLLWSRIRSFMREPFSEFFGVFILILFGDGVVAQVVLSGYTKGNYQSISWGWG
jgi:hypothetical protein